MNLSSTWRAHLAVGVAAAVAAVSLAQTSVPPDRPLSANVIVPQARGFTLEHGTAVEVTEVAVHAQIVEQVATTTMDIALQNPGRNRLEAELLVPVPDGAVVRGFTFQGGGTELNAVLLEKDAARRTYEAIVARVRDPALLEFAGGSLLRSSVFPVPPGGTQKVRLTYEHVLPREGARVDYELPRSESLDYTVPWHIRVEIRSKAPLATVYSPSHLLEVSRKETHTSAAHTSKAGARTPGPFRLSYLCADEGVTASLLAYPDPKIGGGYFLLLAGAPQRPRTDNAAPVRREVLLVLDRSGSMAGEKIVQARAAAAQVIAGLSEGEAFNIYAYNQGVEPFAASACVKSGDTEKAARAFLDRITANGGTNIHEALTQALTAAPAPGTLPLVLFLTDGLPTVGNTSEIAIRQVATEHNPHNRRIFTFGVGVDVNTPLLQNIALETRGTSTFVLPGEDVEAKVAQIYKGLHGPVLTDATLNVLADLAGPAAARVSEMLPSRLPDLFEDDQLVVLGRYAGDQPLDFELRGSYRGRDRVFRFNFPLTNATTRNAFVPRLWASRRIAELIDAIRKIGAEPAGPTIAARTKELTDEVLRLSQEYGILTEYTAFLAHEGTDLSQRDAVLRRANENMQARAQAVRSGVGAVNQGVNIQNQMRQQVLNNDNRFLDENLREVSITAVQQVNDRAFFHRNDRWVDSRVVEREQAKPDRVVEFGSAEYHELLRRMAVENRAGTLALQGDILMLVGDELLLIKGAPGGPAKTASPREPADLP